MRKKLSRTHFKKRLREGISFIPGRLYARNEHIQHLLDE